MENTIWFIVKNLSKTFIYFVCHLFCMQTAHLHMEESVGRLVDSVKEKCYKQNYNGGGYCRQLENILGVK